MQGKQLRTHLKKAGKKTRNCLKKAAWQTCKCATWISCAPCLCCALLCLPRGRRHGCVINGGPIEYVRPEFPMPRQRALSLPLIAAHIDQFTQDQPGSDLMTKLPLEIRRMVYERTLGGASIHLATYGGKPNAKECWRDECRYDYFDPLQEKRLTFGLGLLRTCRVIYSEAIEYLYSANRFCLSTDNEEISTLDHLSWYFLPQRLIQIRDLRIYWELDSMSNYLMSELPSPYLQPWLKSWGALSRLTGLRRLHINLEYRHTHWNTYYEELWKERGEELLKAVKTITAPREFIITLPDRSCETDIDVGDSKCVLKLPDESRSTTIPPLG